MKSIKVNLDPINLHKQDYYRYKQNLSILKNTKAQINDSQIEIEIDKLIEFCEFNIESSLDCIFNQIQEIERKSEDE